VYELEHYLTPQERDVYGEWYRRLRDAKARRQIDRRLDRVILGNFGDHKSCGSGVWELRIDVGPGYRIYYGRSGERIVLLLCGGDKSTQPKDIEKAREYWIDWQERGGIK
jgi:putative addiction module killer protein